MDLLASIVDIGAKIVPNFGKDMALGHIEAEFRQMPEEWIQRWVRGEVFFLKDYIIPHYGRQLPQYKKYCNSISGFYLSPRTSTMCHECTTRTN